MSSKLASLLLAFGLVASAFSAPECEIKLDGCTTGAGYISAGGQKLSECQWVSEMNKTLSDLQNVGVCAPATKVCELKTDGCSTGAAWLSYEGKQLTACKWMADLAPLYGNVASAGICTLAPSTCSYKVSNSCVTGAGLVYINDKQVSDCKFLSDASDLIRSLRGNGLCQ